ncbi:uncharacterized protein MONBRDRAFT_31750 [Monosiga brevicollis MX1]|uniref:Uncharacterized protein n=1 Tax=Monosiga brevicollis TaxID=81824 RepID=A9UUF8_MONBE|nr:uncharacterized protein MONBRDRAFT_31750 [Monosiga brevicollis MX1]EDQ91091.1 predicted protein [Monosiga brevicollis MX1]|eukprot:XP_001744388.1 hypothetical protein [Monosiga brevicollis MX1]
MVQKVAMALVAILAALALVNADVYMHNPRGSNNRLEERSANRANGNRMFDSQNNNRGGYNKGDSDDTAFGNNEDKQYDFQYFMSHPKAWETPYDSAAVGRSILTVEWTNQHGCGGNEHDDPHKLNCNLILQYMCIPDDPEDADISEGGRTGAASDCEKECLIPNENNPTCTPSLQFPCRKSPVISRTDCEDFGGVWVDGQINDEYNCIYGTDPNNGMWPRDGVTTNRQEYDQFANTAETVGQRQNRFNGDVRADRGLHETWEWYDECYRRERNRGLFTADQNLRNNNAGYSSAVFTRQNPNDNRRGYECPEERDYWPYWHPSPWVDIVIMTDRLDLCPFFQTESQNVKGKGLCRNTAACPNCVRYNTFATCTANSGRWVMAAPHGVPAPECIQAPWSRVNHLGNGRFGQPNTYNWTLPYLTLDGSLDANAGVDHRCVLRLRYNISTDDYDAWKVNSTFNNNDGAGIVSPVKQNPNVDIGAKNTALRLAINTAQFGRTFQDRSHVFRLVPRVESSALRDRLRSTVDTTDDFFFGERTLYNLNVRGKRGNIVQTFPSVEYDFVPNQLHVTEDDLIHIQWAGSNTHNNANPAGDGQAGDAGEGRGGTDRHNFVQMLSGDQFKTSFPVPWENNTLFGNMIDAIDAFVPAHGNRDTIYRLTYELDSDEETRTWAEVKRDWALRMATAGFYTSYNADGDSTSIANNNQNLNNLLDNADASYVGGVFRFRAGTYDYMCTRNNNFSNRDQKGHLIVTV